MSAPFKTGDRVIYTEKGKPSSNYDVLADVMIVERCVRHMDYFQEGMETKYIVSYRCEYVERQSWDWAHDVRLITPLDEAMK